MKLGFDLLLWTTHVTDDHWPIIEKLKATGYDGVEIPMFEGDVGALSARSASGLADLGLECTGIGVMPGGGKSAISADRPNARPALDHLKWLIDCTEALGGKLLAGPFHQPLGEFSGAGPTADEMARVAEVHKAAAQYAATAGIDLSVEPLNRFECYFLNTAAQAADLVKRVGRAELRLSLRHLPFQHRGKLDRRRDRADTIRDQPRPHFREQSRRARRRPYRLPRGVRGAYARSATTAG